MSVSAGTAGVIADIRAKLRGKIGQTKVHRYWPGKRPEWADEEEEDEEKQEEKKEPEPVRPVKAEDDPRLRRLAEGRRNRDETVARHRQIRQAEVVSVREEEEEKEKVVIKEEKVLRVPDEDVEEDEDALEEKRRQNRERILQKQREEEAAAAAAAMEVDGEEEEEDEEDEEDEYETDSDEEVGGIPMVKPIFVKKSERETIAERERMEAEEIALEEEWIKKLELRKQETKHMVVEEIKKEEEREKNKVADVEGEEIDTDEETNEAEEYEAWKAREMARIRRERDEKETAAKEKEEIEKLRNMTEEERREYERKNPKETAAPKKKWRYMQKYYHKGAFFQSGTDDKVVPGGNDIYKRDYSEPTGEDRLNKTILPKVMQVKNFGRSGRTKWSHLVNEDTTRWESPWSSNDKLRNSYNEKMAGINKPIEKPRGRKMKRSVDELYRV